MEKGKNTITIPGLQEKLREIKRKALEKKLKELESAPYFKVEYPMSEFVFGCWSGLIPFDEFPDHILNPAGRPRKYDYSKKKKQQQEEEYPHLPSKRGTTNEEAK